MNADRLSRIHIGILPLLMGLMVSGCMARSEVVRADHETSPASASQRPASVPDALRGVWYIDGVEGRASCRIYLNTDAATIEQTGHDPLVGAVVVTRQMIHRYSEYGEGNFFRVDKSSQHPGRVWMLKGQVFIDMLPGDGGYGADHVERFELAKNGQSFSSSDAGDRSFFRCGDVRSDLYSAK